jgi:hypothetical protein
MPIRTLATYKRKLEYAPNLIGSSYDLRQNGMGKPSGAPLQGA